MLGLRRSAVNPTCEPSGGSMGSVHKLNGASAAWPEITLVTSAGRTLTLVAGAIAFTVVGAAMAFGWLDGIEPWSKGWLAGWACLVFFPVCALLGLRQALTSGPVVAIGPRGILDTRISPQFIPWTAIAGISENSVRGTHFLVLRIDPAFEATMTLTPLARLGHRGNAALGWRGYGVAAAGLKGGFKALKQTVEDGLARSRAAGHPFGRSHDG
jgi:hypothetical protein